MVGIDTEFRLEVKPWKPLPNGDYLLQLRFQPDFVFTFASGRKEEYSVSADVVMPLTLTIGVGDLNSLGQAIGQQATQEITRHLGRTLYLATRGFILRYRRNGRVRARPIAKWNVKEISKIITL